MVTARAPARTLGGIGDRLHGLISDTAFKPFKFTQPDGNTEQMEIVGAVRRTLPALSPATRRMLDAVRQAQTIRADPASRFEFRGYVNRADIAAVMHKSRLVPYDVQKLNKLLERHLMSEDYHALPTMTMRGADGQELQYGAGGEYIYQIPPKIMYALIFIDDPGSLEILKLRGEARAAALSARAEPGSSSALTAKRLAVAHADARLYIPERAAPRWWRGMSTLQMLALVMLVLMVVSAWAVVAALVLRLSPV